MNEVCRLCLKLVDPKFANARVELNSCDEVGFPARSVLKSLVPELYLGVSQNPVICVLCYESIKDAYKLRMRCLRSENLISIYMRETHCDLTAIDLKDVQNYWRNYYKSHTCQNDVASANLKEWFGSAFQKSSQNEKGVDGDDVENDLSKIYKDVHEKNDFGKKFFGSDKSIASKISERIRTRPKEPCPCPTVNSCPTGNALKQMTNKNYRHKDCIVVCEFRHLPECMYYKPTAPLPDIELINRVTDKTSTLSVHKNDKQSTSKEADENPRDVPSGSTWKISGNSEDNSNDDSDNEILQILQDDGNLKKLGLIPSDIKTKYTWKKLNGKGTSYAIIPTNSLDLNIQSKIQQISESFEEKADESLEAFSSIKQSAKDNLKQHQPQRKSLANDFAKPDSVRSEKPEFKQMPVIRVKSVSSLQQVPVVNEDLSNVSQNHILQAEGSTRTIDAPPMLKENVNTASFYSSACRPVVLNSNVDNFIRHKKYVRIAPSMLPNIKPQLLNKLPSPEPLVQIPQKTYLKSTLKPICNVTPLGPEYTSKVLTRMKDGRTIRALKPLIINNRKAPYVNVNLKESDHMEVLVQSAAENEVSSESTTVRKKPGLLVKEREETVIVKKESAENRAENITAREGDDFIDIKEEPLDYESANGNSSEGGDGEETRSASETSWVSKLINDDGFDQMVAQFGSDEEYDQPEYVHINNVPFSELGHILNSPLKLRVEDRPTLITNAPAVSEAQNTLSDLGQEHVNPQETDKKVVRKRKSPKKRVRLVPVDEAALKAVPPDKKRKIQEKIVKKDKNGYPGDQTNVCVLFTNFTSDGDYINDHDYLINPYERNTMAFKKENALCCLCLLCGLYHSSKNHIKHMKYHSSRCAVCNIDFKNVFILNLHVRCHTYHCPECKVNVNYARFRHHAETHNKSAHLSNIKLAPERKEFKRKNKSSSKKAAGTRRSRRINTSKNRKKANPQEDPYIYDTSRSRPRSLEENHQPLYTHIEKYTQDEMRTNIDLENCDLEMPTNMQFIRLADLLDDGDPGPSDLRININESKASLVLDKDKISAKKTDGLVRKSSSQSLAKPKKKRKIVFSCKKRRRTIKPISTLSVNPSKEETGEVHDAKTEERSEVERHKTDEANSQVMEDKLTENIPLLQSEPENIKDLKGKSSENDKTEETTLRTSEAENTKDLKRKSSGTDKKKQVTTLGIAQRKSKRGRYTENAILKDEESSALPKTPSETKAPLEETKSPKLLTTENISNSTQTIINSNEELDKTNRKHTLKKNPLAIKEDIKDTMPVQKGMNLRKSKPKYVFMEAKRRRLQKTKFHSPSKNYAEEDSSKKYVALPDEPEPKDIQENIALPVVPVKKVKQSDPITKHFVDENNAKSSDIVVNPICTTFRSTRSRGRTNLVEGLKIGPLSKSSRKSTASVENKAEETQASSASVENNDDVSKHPEGKTKQRKPAASTENKADETQSLSISGKNSDDAPQ